ncbi:MAG: zinc metalloprotease, partial [Proteobacteria bacterium]|nr:zinc metalloprotease [Pseudomonadota bacterium]
MDYLQMQKAAEPKLEKRMNLVESQVQQWIQNHPNLKTSGPAVITVPVVFHVVWKTSSQNISDAQIFSQIDVLNEDFRRLNADASNTPSWFTSVAADCEIEFCLAQRDPTGNSTTGITRTQTTVTSFSTNDNIKQTSQGGKDAWPRDDYLNIWVGNLSGGLLGYATFPGAAAWRDGVVIDYQTFGTIGTASWPYDEGRTGTHEVGHWFGLYHTFQGGCAGTSSSTCSTNGDRVCDTPPTSSSNTGCPSINQNTCTETPTDQKDMHMNYMDYTNDACMNLFSLGQKSRMQAVLSGTRSSLQSSQGCVPVNLQNLDAGVSAIITPNGTLCQSSITPEVTLKNFGLTTLTSATINYQVDAGPVNTYSWTGSLATLAAQNVTLPSITASAGAHTFTAYTSAPNGGIDDDPANDNVTGSFAVQTIGDTLPFFEGFENPTFPPAGWQVINPDGSFTWERTTLAAKSSTASARMENAVYPANELIDELIFLNLDLTDVT